MKLKILKILNIFLFLIMALSAIAVAQAAATEKTDYKTMIKEIGDFFDEALLLYKEGNTSEAKSKAQSAYFEVFENLEGPIRINISARKNFELEEEFIGIRNMIKDGETAEAVERRINNLMVELTDVVSELEGGFELVAEPAERRRAKTFHATENNKLSAADIESVWLKASENIQSELEKALKAYKKGDAKNASTFVINAQFDGYKNTLMETVVRRHISQGKDYENNSGFSDLMAMIRDGRPAGEIEQRISSLMEGIRGNLPSLPVIEGAVSKTEDKKITGKEVPDKDWRHVTDNLFAEIEQAVVMYKEGEKREAVEHVQDIYFDIFEASGMESKIGARDAGFKARLEGHFSMIVGQMKKGVVAGKIEEIVTVMKTDFDKAVNMLAKGADSPMALFIYSLLIILREGFEGILIITAIIAYLIKTGHRDKLGVIYNGCVSALILSILTAVFVKWVFKVSAASQEILEGGTMILAAVVLFSVSYWLISKVEAKKWTAYIKGKVSSSLSSGSLKALWFVAFLAVYREGAETVLFYQALASGASGSGLTWISAGFVIGCALLAGVYLVMKFGAVRLPIRPFFLVTGGLLYYMAFVFAGKGMMEFIEGKVFEPSMVSWMPTVSFIGVYPYWQTMIPQMLLVIAALSALAFMMRQRGNAT